MRQHDPFIGTSSGRKPCNFLTGITDPGCGSPITRHAGPFRSTNRNTPRADARWPLKCRELMRRSAATPGTARQAVPAGCQAGPCRKADASRRTDCAECAHRPAATGPDAEGYAVEDVGGQKTAGKGTGEATQGRQGGPGGSLKGQCPVNRQVRTGQKPEPDCGRSGSMKPHVSLKSSGPG